MTTKHKIFIAINFSKDNKEKISNIKYLKKFSNLQIHWDSEDNLHLNILFIGLVDNENLYKSILFLKSLKNISPFSIKISKICPGPPNTKAKMIWALIEKNNDLEKLYKKLLKINDNIITCKKGKSYKFIPHITLGKILQAKNLDEISEEKVDIKLQVNSIEILESIPQDKKIKYITLEKLNLNNNLY